MEKFIIYKQCFNLFILKSQTTYFRKKQKCKGRPKFDLQINILFKNLMLLKKSFKILI